MLHQIYYFLIYEYYFSQISIKSYISLHSFDFRWYSWKTNPLVLMDFQNFEVHSWETEICRGWSPLKIVSISTNTGFPGALTYPARFVIPLSIRHLRISARVLPHETSFDKQSSKTRQQSGSLFFDGFCFSNIKICGFAFRIWKFAMFEYLGVTEHRVYADLATWPPISCESGEGPSHQVP